MSNSTPPPPSRDTNVARKFHTSHPLAIWRKFSTVLGTTSPNSPMTTRPAAVPLIVMSKNTLWVMQVTSGDKSVQPEDAEYGPRITGEDHADKTTTTYQNISHNRSRKFLATNSRQIAFVKFLVGGRLPSLLIGVTTKVPYSTDRMCMQLNVRWPPLDTPIPILESRSPHHEVFPPGQARARVVT